MSLRFVFLGVVVLATCRTYTVTYTDPCADSGVSTGLVQCNGTCTDLGTDRNNCGACGVVCGANALCFQNPDGGGSCQPCTQAGQVVCGTGGGAFCADTTSDNTNCGACGVICAHGAHCVSSACQCTLTSCAEPDGGTACVDTQTDIANCGGCNAPCGPAGPNEVELCTGGHCGAQCTAPFADCDGIATNGCEANLQTDPANCGVCKRSCGAGTCASGLCPVTTYASGSSLNSLAIDPTYVYWAADVPAGGIFEAPIGAVSPDGGSTAQLVYAISTASFVQVDATRVTWLQSGSALESRLLGGGAVTQLATVASGKAVALSNGVVYYAASDGTLARVPEDGSSGATTMSTLASAAQAIVADATNVYFIVSGDIDYEPITTSQGTPSSFAPKQNAVGLAVDASNVYWTTQTGAIISAPKIDPTAMSTLVTGQTGPAAISSDGTSIYWADGDGTIRRATTNGWSQLTLATGQGSPVAIAVDASNVYWSSGAVVASTVK